MTVHRIDIQVRFSDTDMLGHVNNASYASWVEIARLQFLEGLGEPVRSVILASLHIDYRHQVEYRDRVRVETWIERLGTSSVTLGQTIFANDERAADVKSVIVQFDYTTSKSRPIDANLRATLERFVLPSHMPE